MEEPLMTKPKLTYPSPGSGVSLLPACPWPSPEMLGFSKLTWGTLSSPSMCLLQLGGPSEQRLGNEHPGSTGSPSPLSPAQPCSGGRVMAHLAANPGLGGGAEEPPTVSVAASGSLLCCFRPHSIFLHGR